MMYTLMSRLPDLLIVREREKEYYEVINVYIFKKNEYIGKYMEKVPSLEEIFCGNN